MIIDTTTDIAELPETIQYVNRILDLKVVQSCISDVEKKYSNLWLRDYIAEYFGLELAYGRMLKFIREEQRYPSHLGDAQEYRLCAFLTSLTRVHQKLSKKGQKRLEGCLHGQFTTDVGLRPLAYEFSVAVHLMKLGFEVEFHDLEEGCGFDFLVLEKKMSFEVECKHLSADAGRQIHRREFAYLLAHLSTMLEGIAQDLGGGWHVTIKFAERLTANLHFLNSVSSCFESLISQMGGRLENGEFVVSMRPLTDMQYRDLISAEPLKGVDEIKSLAEEISGLDNVRHVVLRRGSGIVLFTASSKKADTVLKTLSDRIAKDAKKQFSKERPGVLFAKLSDLTGAELIDLAESQKDGYTPLQIVASRLLNRRHHLHSLVLTTEGEVIRRTNIFDSNITENGYTLKFSKNTFPDDVNAVIERALT